ncbi:hypothetical protein [Sporomusa sp.]|uniref:hypothetical protein n=1 Tax=Sporomusa sp. TaxID=2078658 RepID=UPI002BCAF658|nr:hypothetical protein [Sporomusa sp.]HWR42274.1 hypothetical protein [Sporomusa sp.]
MDIQTFDGMLLLTQDDSQRLELVRKYLFHGTPFVFKDKESEYFEFRNRIANQFQVSFQEVFIVGSAKLGFSWYKGTDFNLNSDIDVVIVNESLFEHYTKKICDYQYELDRARYNIDFNEKKLYNSFLQYMVKGWMRPDKLPISFQVGILKTEWFDFFNSISYGSSEVGNYEVSGGLYRNYYYLEKYYRLAVDAHYKTLKMRGN